MCNTRLMLFLLFSVVAADPWSLGRRQVTESDVVGMTLSYFESLVSGTTTRDVKAELLKSHDPQRHGCLSLLILFGPHGDDRLAVAAAAKGDKSGCSLCKSLLGFFAGEGFWHGYGDLSGSAELPRRLPELAEPQADSENAILFYRDALKNGATDPLALLGLLTSSRSQGVDVCSELLTRVSLLADRSLENCVSLFPKPQFVEDLDRVEEFSVAHAHEREQELWLLLHSGEIAIPEDPEFRSEMAKQAADVLKELHNRDPDAHSSRVAQALESYISEETSHDQDSAHQLRNMLELIKRNHIVAKYNKAINKHSCQASMNSLTRLIYENNRFTRILHSLFVWHWQQGNKMQAYWASLMLGRMGSASGLLNAALVAETIDPIPVEDGSKPLDFLRVHLPRVQGVTCPEDAMIHRIDIQDKLEESTCENTCIDSVECKHVLFVPFNESSSRCYLFRSCETTHPTSADDKEGLIFDKVIATRDDQKTCWLLRGACVVNLYETAANLTDSIAAYTWLSRDAWNRGDHMRSYTWSVAAARKGSEEAKLNLALFEMYDWPGHPVDEERGLQLLWTLLTEDDPIRRSGAFDQYSLELDIAMLSGSELGQQIMELLDMDWESLSGPSTFPRRVAALVCFSYYWWQAVALSVLDDVEIDEPVLIAMVVGFASMIIWWLLRQR